METCLVVSMLKVLPVFTCGTCGRKAQGTTFRIELSSSTIDGVVDQFRKLPAKSADMPFGWSFNGKFKCSECLSHYDDKGRPE